MLNAALMSASLLLGQADPIQVRETRVQGAPVRVVEVRLTDPRVRVGLIVAEGFPGTDESFGAMLRRAQPAAAINGTYFDKETLKPIGDLVENGELLHSGRTGTAFTISQDGTLDIHRVVRHRTMRWEGMRTVLACGPALLLDGKVDVDPAGEGFRNPAVIGKTQRMGVGYTADRRLLLVHIRSAVSFEQMAQIMQRLGAVEAMNLDAGASLAMAVRGKTYAQPSRRLTNLLGIWIDRNSR